MKKIYLTLVMALFLLSFAQAQVSLDKAPEEIYNVGELLEISVKINPEPIFQDRLTITLDCGENEKTELHKQYHYTETEKTISIQLPLTREYIGNSLGECVVDAKYSNTKESISKNFKISELIIMQIKDISQRIAPGESVTLEGSLKTESGNEVKEGEVTISSNFNGKKVEVKTKVENSSFSTKFNVPEKVKAGDQEINYYIAQKNSNNQVINKGETIDYIEVKQIPTNIEIELSKKELVPLENAEIEIILYDQTGEEMDTEVEVTIRNSKGEIIERVTKDTGLIFRHKIPEKESPGKWEVSAFTNGIRANEDFKIMPDQKIDIEIMNETMLIKNIGNVAYNRTVDIEIGKELISVDVYLELDEEQKYTLYAPKGSYSVKAGDVQKTVYLTGRAIDVKKGTSGISESNPFLFWVFLIIILLAISFIAYKRYRKKPFFTRKKKGEYKQISADKPKVTTGFISSSKNASLSLSIVGTKQNACIGCISIKNYEEVKSGAGNVKETFNKITSLVEGEKGFIYNNKDHVFFIFAPALTKTFKNEITGVKISDKILKILKEHNKKFKQRIEFGLSLNYGTIVTKQEAESLKFMSMGTSMTETKKLANSAKEQIYISKKIKERLGKDVKTEVKELGTITGYIIKEIVEKVEHSSFLKGFVERQKKEEIERRNKEEKKAREQKKKDSN